MVGLKTALVDTCVFVDAFDPGSPNHVESYAVLHFLRERDYTITMPAHAWFEIECTLRKLTADSKYVAPEFRDGLRYPIRLLHIDAKFIERYKMVDIPYIKAGDHIFLAVAKLDGYSLITSDLKMRKIAKKSGIRVFHPRELVQ